MTPKYRVWDTRDERMLIVKEMYFGPNGPTAVRVLGNVSISPYKKTDFLRIPRGIVMQWTGLKDIDDVNAYAGDIIDYASDGFRALLMIDWSDADACFIIRNKLGGRTGFKIYEVLNEGRIIGNTHATHELLNTTV